MKKDLAPQGSIAYGSIYLDDGEDPEEMLTKQLESFRGHEPKFIFFDILCNKDQIDMALAVRGYCQQEFQAELDMSAVAVYVAVGLSYSKTKGSRPAQDAMAQYLQ